MARDVAIVKALIASVEILLVLALGCLVWLYVLLSRIERRIESIQHGCEEISAGLGEVARACDEVAEACNRLTLAALVMSNHFRTTRNPITGKFERAEWLDNYFGGRVFGVRFSTGQVLDERNYKWEFQKEPVEQSYDGLEESGHGRESP